MPTLIGAPSLIGAPDSIAEPDRLGTPALGVPSLLFGRETPYIPGSPPPAADTGLPVGLPSDFFAVAAKTGELSRMWIITGAPNSGYVFGTAPRPVVGTGYTLPAKPFVDAGLPINAIRLPNNVFRLHHGGSPSFAAWIEERNGGADEPDLAIYVHLADTSAEFKLREVSSDGGSYANWATNTGLKTNVRAALLTAGTRAIMILADATT